MSLTVSKEVAADGQARSEKEYVWYAQITSESLSALERLQVHTELQEQYEIFGENSSVRVRGIDDRDYEVTTKVWVPGVFGKQECTLPINQTMFEMFQPTAQSGIRKQRFVVVIPNTEGSWGENHPNFKYGGNLFFEFDVFYRKIDGKEVPQEWVKIDLEVPTALETLPQFPIPLKALFSKQPVTRSENESAFVRNLFDNVFSRKVEENTKVSLEDFKDIYGDIFEVVSDASVESLVDPVASVEGFLDPITNAFKAMANWVQEWRTERIVRRPKPDSERRDSAQNLYDIIKQLRRTYGNETWLKARQFAEGQIDISAIAQFLYVGDDDIDPTGNTILRNASLLLKYLKAAEVDLNKVIVDQRKYWNRIQSGSSEKAIRVALSIPDQLVEYLKSFEDFKVPVELPDQRTLGIVGEKLSIQQLKVTSITKVKQLPPVEFNKAVDVVEILIDLLETIILINQQNRKLTRLPFVFFKDGDVAWTTLYEVVAERRAERIADAQAAGESHPHDGYTRMKEDELLEVFGEDSIDGDYFDYDWWIEAIDELTHAEIRLILEKFDASRVVEIYHRSVNEAMYYLVQGSFALEKWVARSIVK